VIDTLCEEHRSLCDTLLADGYIRPHFKITLNGHDITLLQGLDTAVCEDDQIAIFPPIAGG
jgi:molybdopterin converting factor small subunit